ncbi:MAG: hypothetical protein LBC20_03020 [Planctomycetaceae bacterium]|nr:hypothetical protein [Planctomycetaceae bacterium]
MTKLEFVQQRIVQLRTFLLSNEPVLSVSGSGMSVTYDRSGALAELKELERQETDLLNPTHRFKTIDLGGSFY